MRVQRLDQVLSRFNKPIAAFSRLLESQRVHYSVAPSTKHKSTVLDEIMLIQYSSAYLTAAPSTKLLTSKFPNLQAALCSLIPGFIDRPVSPMYISPTTIASNLVDHTSSFIRWHRILTGQHFFLSVQEDLKRQF